MEKKITRFLFHQYSGQELQQKGQELSATIEEMEKVEDKKKAATAQLSEEIKDLRGGMRDLSRKIHERGEMKPVECIVRFHQPTVASKEIFRVDTGEKIAEEAMSHEECQSHLFDSTELTIDAHTTEKQEATQ